MKVAEGVYREVAEGSEVQAWVESGDPDLYIGSIS